jgi:hypothetical protein
MGIMAKYREAAKVFQRERYVRRIFGLLDIVKQVKAALPLCVLSKCKIDVQYDHEHGTMICYHNGESIRIKGGLDRDIKVSGQFDKNGTIVQAAFNGFVPQIVTWTRERHVHRDTMQNDWDYLRKRRFWLIEEVTPVSLERRAPYREVVELDIENIVSHDLNTRKERRR